MPSCRKQNVSDILFLKTRTRTDSSQCLLHSSNHSIHVCHIVSEHHMWLSKNADTECDPFLHAITEGFAHYILPSLNYQMASVLAKESSLSIGGGASGSVLVFPCVR